MVGAPEMAQGDGPSDGRKTEVDKAQIFFGGSCIKNLLPKMTLRLRIFYQVGAEGRYHPACSASRSI